MPDKATANTDVSLSRRQSLLLGGSLLAGGTTLAATTFADRATALSVDSFNVQDATFEKETITPELIVDLAYSYQVNDAPDEVRLQLLVGGKTVDQTILTSPGSTLDDTTRLSGLVTDTSAWASEDFTVNPGESVSRDLNVSILLEVLRDNSVIVSDEKTDTVTVTVTHPDELSLKASVGGSGEIQAA